VPHPEDQRSCVAVVRAVVFARSTGALDSDYSRARFVHFTGVIYFDYNANSCGTIIHNHTCCSTYANHHRHARCHR
jgi:hypothetical protein